MATDQETKAQRVAAIKNSPSYRQAHLDQDFMGRDELRPVRLQLELQKPELMQAELGVVSTIVVFGGTRILEKTDAERRAQSAREALAEDPESPDLQR